jgi:hypothetical protein
VNIPKLIRQQQQTRVQYEQMQYVQVQEEVVILKVPKVRQQTAAVHQQDEVQMQEQVVNVPKISRQTRGPTGAPRPSRATATASTVI